MTNWEHFFGDKNPVIVEKFKSLDSNKVIDDIFSECELASYWVGVSLSDCADSLDKIIKK